MLYLLDEMPFQVIAQGGNYLNQDITDVTMTMLSFKSGVQGHIFVSWLHPDKEQKLVIVGDQKMAVFNDTLTQGKLQIHDKGVDWINRQPVPRKNGITLVPLDNSEPLKAECEHFLHSITSDSTPKSDGNNGIKVLKVLNACQDSLKQHGATVDLNGSNHSKPFFSHETAIVDKSCLVGDGTKIWHFSHVMPGAQIGSNCNIGQNVVLSPAVKIGNNVKIQNNVSVYSGVVLEDDVFCGPSMVFTNVINPRSHISRKNEFQNTLVKKGATIGANSTIVCGNTIGKYAFIGAGAVVTKDVPNHALVLGNPARISGWVCECCNRLYFHNDVSTCSSCNKQYKMIDEEVKCLECNCNNKFEIHDDVKVRIDGNKRSNSTYDKESTTPQEAGYCSIH